MSNWRIWGDWGTTRLRLWRVEDGKPVDFREGAGIGQLVDTPEDTLRQALAPWLTGAAPGRIVLCGMVGARNGLHEAGYADCPADAASWRRSAAITALDGISLRIGAGVACRGADGRPDVMRGEETQLFGAIRRDPALARGSHVAVMPGTHSKWVAFEEGRIASFRTFLTGELFALLQGSSLLSAGREGTADEIGDGFGHGLARAQADGGVLGGAFETRAAQLRDGHSAAWAADFLSGLLLGCELAEMRRLGGLPAAVTVIGGAALVQRYARALAAFHVSATLLDGDECALAGLELLDADD